MPQPPRRRRGGAVAAAAVAAAVGLLGSRAFIAAAPGRVAPAQPVEAALRGRGLHGAPASAAAPVSVSAGVGGAAALLGLSAALALRRRRPRSALPRSALPQRALAWKGHTPVQSSLPVRADGSVVYDDIDASPISKVLMGTTRALLAEVAGGDNATPGFDGLMDLVRVVNDMGGTAEDLQLRARGVFEGLLPALNLGWVGPIWKNQVQPSFPTWATSFAFVQVFRNLFPWLMGPMEGEDFVEVKVPRALRSVLFFLPESVQLAQTVKAERCRFLEGTQCASVCVNTCKVPSQTWLGADFGMPVHVEPNYEDFSCRWHFGVQPPPLHEDEAVMSPCFTKCPSKSKGSRDALSLRERMRAEALANQAADGDAAGDEAGADATSGRCRSIDELSVVEPVAP